MWAELGASVSFLTKYTSSAAALVAAWYSLQPPECQLALTTAGSICAGTGPLLTFPLGFGPVLACWGWALVAFVFGVVFGALVVVVVWWCSSSLFAWRSSWLPLVEQALRVTNDPIQKDVLLFLRDGGAPALRDLAKQARTTPEALLVDVLHRGSNAEVRKRNKKHIRK